jgi:hypothetical protein
MDVQWKPSPLVFHLTYLTLTALLGTFRGIAAAAWERPAREILLRLAGHVLFGQLIVLPYLFFARSLLPGKELVLPVLVTYSSLASFMFAAIALRLDSWGRARNAHTFMLQYALFAFLFLVPWSLGFVPGVPSIVTLFSPIGTALRVMQSPSPLDLFVAYAFVLAVALTQLLAIRRTARRPHAV